MLHQLRARWQAATAADIDDMVAEIERWQQSLWQFHSIGHIGRKGASERWMTAKDPLTQRQHLSLDLPARPPGQEFSIFLTAKRIAGEDAVVAWRNPRLQIPGMPPVLLRDVMGAKDRLEEARRHFLENLSEYLLAASQVQSGAQVRDAAVSHRLSIPIFDRWLAYLRIGNPQRFGAGAGTFGSTHRRCRWLPIRFRLGIAGDSIDHREFLR